MPAATTNAVTQTQTTQSTQSVASLPLTHHSGKLQASTHVTMGALSEQIADDVNRPAAEREAFRAKARQSYQKAIETDAKYSPAYLALAASYAATNECEQAVANFAMATQVAPNDAAAWTSQGQYFARLKEWDQAIESLSRAMQLEPGNKETMKKLGFALARAGRVDEGYAMLARCMGEAEARYNVARMLQHLEQPMACRWYLQMALQADPNYEPAREALAALSAGEGTSVRPIGYNETPPAAQTAPVVQTAAYTEPDAATGQAAPTGPPVIINGSTVAAAPPTVATATTGTGKQPVVILNRPAAAASAEGSSPTTAAPNTASGDLPQLPPVILGSRDVPSAPIKAGADGIDEYLGTRVIK
jgi:Tfp pilus assembly protein PilF